MVFLNERDYYKRRLKKLIIETGVIARALESRIYEFPGSTIRPSPVFVLIETGKPYDGYNRYLSCTLS